MRREFCLASLVLVPYAIAALTAVGPAISADDGRGPVEVRPAAAVPATRLSDSHCREQARPDPSEAARVLRVQQYRHDPQARSQRPTWQAQAQAEVTDCLRAEADGKAVARRGVSKPPL